MIDSCLTHKEAAKLVNYGRKNVFKCACGRIQHENQMGTIEVNKCAEIYSKYPKKAFSNFFFDTKSKKKSPIPKPGFVKRICSLLVLLQNKLERLSIV